MDQPHEVSVVTSTLGRAQERDGEAPWDTVTTLPRGRALTRADLAAMPDDGHRHELVDGVLVVTPAPEMRHQRAVLERAVRLRAAVRDGRPLPVRVVPASPV